MHHHFCCDVEAGEFNFYDQNGTIKPCFTDQKNIELVGQDGFLCKDEVLPVLLGANVQMSNLNVM